uniref:Uncharacterized protein n=1 Tax=Sphaerodactylus townsendi TaxID=933632 RepID=A0ACB8F946_9SAUR
MARLANLAGRRSGHVPDELCGLQGRPEACWGQVVAERQQASSSPEGHAAGPEAHRLISSHPPSPARRRSQIRAQMDMKNGGLDINSEVNVKVSGRFGYTVDFYHLTPPWNILQQAIKWLTISLIKHVCN